MVNLKVIENIIKNMVIDMKEIGKMEKEKVKVFVIILMEIFIMEIGKMVKKIISYKSEGKKNGKGVYYFKNGDIFDGILKDGKRRELCKESRRKGGRCLGERYFKGKG